MRQFLVQHPFELQRKHDLAKHLQGSNNKLTSFSAGRASTTNPRIFASVLVEIRSKKNAITHTMPPSLPHKSKPLERENNAFT
jgi:hypothetical protein